MEEIIKKYGRIYHKNDCILFNSNRFDCMVLSNFWPCAIWYKGLRFESVEQLYHWMWADKVSDDNLKERVMSYHGINNGYKIKKDGSIARRMKEIGEEFKQQLGDEAYFLEKWKVISECVNLKFQYCEEYRNFLIKNKGKKFVECCPWGDKMFGAVYNEELNVYEGINASGRCATAALKKYLEENGSNL